MKFGNVYEVLQIGDIVKVKDITSIYWGQIGVIVSISNPGCYVDPIYTIRFDEPSLWSFTDRSEPRETEFNAKNLVKVGHVAHEGEITMGLRSGKTYLTEIGKFKNKDNGFDSIIYQMEKKRKFAERGTDANAISDFYKKEFIKGKDDECLGKLRPCHVTEEAAKIQDKEKNNGNT